MLVHERTHEIPKSVRRGARSPKQAFMPLGRALGACPCTSDIGVDGVEQAGRLS
jgi:hypothetical protein